ncbi:hypothetical protein RB595_006020 [Gaeumannomyces hyphopodioides]
MYRATLRSTARAARSAASTTTLTSTSRRYLSFGPSDKPRTWKGAAMRWGLAFGALYWYNTSPIFADEPLPQTIPAPPQFSDDDLPTVESVIARKRKEAEAREKRAAASAPSTPPPSGKEKKEEAKPAKEDPVTPVAAPEPGSPEALEEEASQQGAFNPETGEINWDCPCLGGMADGPCGEQFKAAFSCFVYSTEEPKGMDCIDKFQRMQDCFKKYPEIYGSELADEDGEEEPTDAPASSEDAPAAAPKEEKDVSEKPEASAAAPAPKEEDKEVQETPKTPSAPATTPEEAPASFLLCNRKKPRSRASSNLSTKMSGTPSYADIAAKGPKQTPEEAAAPQPPQVESSTTASTSSLVDVDTPSVRTVPSDFGDQDVQTDTQADRIEREEEAAAEAKRKARSARERAAARARSADNWLVAKIASLGDGAATALFAGNLAVVMGLGAVIGYKAWGLYERRALGWKGVGLGLGLLGIVGLGEGVFTSAYLKAKGKKQ